MGGIDGFDGFFDSFWEEEDFEKNARLIKSKIVEIKGEKYVEEVWEYGDSIVTKTYQEHKTPVEDENYEEDIEYYLEQVAANVEDIEEEIKEAVAVEDYERAADLKKRLDHLKEILKNSKK